MLSIKALFGRKTSPAPQPPHSSLTERLGDMVVADRLASKDQRIDLINLHPVRPKRAMKRTVQNPSVESQQTRSEEGKHESKQVGKRVESQRAQGRQSNPSINRNQSRQVQSKQSSGRDAAHPKPLNNQAPIKRSTLAATKPQASKPHVDQAAMDKLGLKASATLNELSSRSMERFRIFARSRRLSVARNKTKTGFISQETQNAWLAWKEAEEQTRLQGINSLRKELDAIQKMLHDIQTAPIVSNGAGHEVSDLTLIVKRLAFQLGRCDRESTLPNDAMNYLKRHGLLDA